MPNPPDGSSFVALARVTRPVGLKGGVRVQLLCDSPDRLSQVDHVFRGPTEERAGPAVIAEVSVRGNGVVVFFEDCVDREGAEALRDVYIFVPGEESVPPDEGQARIHELIGASVVTTAGQIVGTVTNVYDVPSHRLVGVTPEGGVEVLVPYVDAWIAGFDREAGRLEITTDELFRIV